MSWLLGVLRIIRVIRDIKVIRVIRVIIYCAHIITSAEHHDLHKLHVSRNLLEVKYEKNMGKYEENMRITWGKYMRYEKNMEKYEKTHWVIWNIRVIR